MDALLNRMLLILFLVLALVVIILVLVAWSKWQNLPPAARTLVFVAAGLVLLIVAPTVGWIEADRLEAAGIPASWESLTGKATDLWFKFDGYTRTHRWIGVVMLALIPALLWPRDDEEVYYGLD